MTLTNPEKLTQPKNYNEVLTIGSFDSLNLDLQSKWLKLRQEFMESKRWHYGDDHDANDANPETVQLILQDENEQITAGLRLTPGNSITETLSWSMMPGLNADSVADIDGKVWDLTRLVPGAIDSSSERMAAFAELFGAGLANNLKYDENPLWVFAITKEFMVAFKRYGIEFTQIPGAKNDDALLAYAYPAERTAFLRDNRHKYPDACSSVELGIERSIQELLG